MGLNHVIPEDNNWTKEKLDQSEGSRPYFEMHGLDEASAIDVYIANLYVYHARQIATSWMDDAHTEHNLLVPEQVTAWDNVIADLRALNIEFPYELVDQAILEVKARREELLM
jgi:predicted glycosyltransferase involved in capsule biosynthesis